MYLVCTPDHYINKDIKEKSESFTHGRVLIALNVGCDTISNSVLITDGVSNGNHWTLLALILKAYYGYSLSWAVPSNLTQMVELLLNKTGIQLDCHTLSPINSTSGASTSHLFKPAPICVVL